ncbi:BTB/POZ protein [Lophiotrema nucula]|uniref:BTB/POZ protein n=1 Tax=Lophiotrema nucula TaxID=690887 RepID=A0A6A5ZXA1_9PLEO|nr:BTB/POZ protein [Lophiotrema nucula]
MAQPNASASASLFNNPILSDIKILQICEGKTKEYYAHRQILAGQSSYFMRAFTGQFKEATEPTMELHDDDPELFEIMLKFVYTGIYNMNEINNIFHNDISKNVLVPVRLSILADKYDINGILPPAAEHALSKLRALSMGNFGSIKACIECLYGACVQPNTAIGQSIVAAMLKHGKGSTKWGQELEPMILRYPILGADIALHQNKQELLNVQKRKCLECHGVSLFMKNYTAMVWAKCPQCRQTGDLALLE